MGYGNTSSSSGASSSSSSSSSGGSSSSTADPGQARPFGRQPKKLFTPHGFYLPFAAPLSHSQGRVVIEVSGKRKEFLAHCIPATKNGRANVKFKSWMLQYSLYAIGEIQSGDSRGALASQMVLNSFGEMKTTFEKWDQNAISYDPAAGVEPRMGGLDYILE